MDSKPDDIQNNDDTTPSIEELFNAYRRAVDVNIISSIGDGKGTILYVNDRFCEVSGYSSKELIGHNHNIVNSGFHHPDFFQQMWKRIKNGETWHGEIKNKAKDGTFYWVETVIIPINTDGKPCYLSLRLIITDRKEAEEQQLEYIGKLRDLLHITSHRVRAPLATCLGLMNILESDRKMSEKEKLVLIGHMKESALQLDEFTRELTHFIADLERKYTFRASESK